MKEIFLSDIHWPFHNRAAFHVALKAIEYIKPDIVHIGGDGIDFHSISRHPKQLIDRTLLKYEVEESRREVGRVRSAAPNAEISWQEGNHDKRMAIYLRDRSPELSDLFELSFPKLLQLEERGIRWIPEHEKYAVGKLWHHHGHLLAGGGKNPAKSKFTGTFQNIIFGHHHVFDYYSIRQYGTNTLYQSVANACLYTLEPEYAHHTSWHVGFTIIDYIPTGDFSIRQVHISRRDDGSQYAIIDGFTFESTDDEDIDRYLSVAAKRLSTRKTARSGSSK
jgi:predicted phosphodiesterase